MPVTIPIWPGSSSFTTGLTPFGYYDSDADFVSDAPKFANWCARRLGYPIMDVELQDVNFFSAFEESVNEFGNQVNSHAARDSILQFLGANISVSSSLTQQYVAPTSNDIFTLAKQYGTEAGSGGNLTYYTGSFTVNGGQQLYDLKDSTVAKLERGNASVDSFTIRKLYHQTPPALIQYFDPYLGLGISSKNLLEQFGWGGMSPAISYMLMPLHYDLMRIQAIEFNDQVRKSSYSFQLINNRVRIFPVPTRQTTLYFDYTLNSEAKNIPVTGSSVNQVSDYSNIPYTNLMYNKINSMGRQWIRKYALAICKETLAFVRGKYTTIPVPSDDANDLTLNYAELLDSAQREKDDLMDELKTLLDQFSRKSLLERRQDEAEAMENQLKKIPNKIYIF